MGLFMGFSFISVAEIVYFSILRPIFKFVLPKKFKNISVEQKELEPYNENKVIPFSIIII